MQYLPCKPIKHGIKGFVLTCAITGCVYSFKIYTGKDGELDGSPLGVVACLIQAAGLVGIGGVGHILYTGKWFMTLECYISMDVPLGSRS